MSARNSPARPSGACARPPSRATAPGVELPTATGVDSMLSIPNTRVTAKSRITLEPEPDEAKVVAEIFELFTAEKLSPRGIAECLNQPGGPPPPRHVDTSRNVRRRWAASTIREMLKNPVYTGRIVWNRRDFATGRQNGGGARLRAQEEWVVSEE